jgi:hypothetical protein
VATLKASGVRRVYGLPGDSLNGFTDALRRDGEIVWEHVRHEEAAAFAAAGEAGMTGQLAVCAASCGPGNLHLRASVRMPRLVGVAFGRTRIGEIPEAGEAVVTGYFPSGDRATGTRASGQGSE